MSITIQEIKSKIMVDTDIDIIAKIRQGLELLFIHLVIGEKYDYILSAVIYTIDINYEINSIIKSSHNDMLVYLEAYEKNYKKYYGIDIWKGKEKPS